ncbi:MAG TPA: MarR family transcriptional regulator [Candidatus Eisenbacteria bacterium]|nr:MarR family transcriptional regulator [Candidatus Eisenbacteria bacterium]
MPATPPITDVHDAIARLQRLTDLFRERRAQLAEDAGLTEQQWEVLERIATERFMPSLFARHRESSAAAVSRLIRQLIEKKLVSVSVSPNDGRQRQYVLTAKGRRTLSALGANRAAAIEAIWTTLDREALATFTRVSDELIRRIETYAERT